MAMSGPGIGRRAFGLAVLAMPALARLARAEAGAVRFSKQYGLPYLAMMVMEEQRLVEAEAARQGLPSLAVQWSSVAGPAQQLDGLLAGAYDFITPGVPTLGTIWDKTVGTAQEVRALCALQSMPYVLVTRNPAVATIADFTDGDRIALPAVKLTGHALTLEMAAAQRWGREQYGRLDPLTVTLSHPDAMAAMLSPKSTVTSHFASSPFYYYELAVPGIRRVLGSYEVVGGKHTNGTLIARKAFRDANPRICAVVMAAFETANAFVKAQPGQAAEIYQKATRETHSSVQELTKMVADPDVDYTIVPKNVMAYIDFMRDVGRLRHAAASWKDLFFPEAQDLAGS